jgi:hypothetical protein
MSLQYLPSAARLSTRGYATATTAPDKLRQAFSYCVDQVRTHDYENYVWCTQLPKVIYFSFILYSIFKKKNSTKILIDTGNKIEIENIHYALI